MKDIKAILTIDSCTKCFNRTHTWLSYYTVMGIHRWIWQVYSDEKRFEYFVWPFESTCSFWFKCARQTWHLEWKVFHIYAFSSLWHCSRQLESTFGDLDEVLRKLEQLESTQKHQMQQMQLQLDDISQRLISTQAELNLVKSSVVQSKALLFKSFHIRWPFISIKFKTLISK